MIKCPQAETFRDLYNDSINSLIDNINIKYTKFIQFNESLDDNNLDDLRKYKKLYDEISGLLINLEIETSKL